MTSPLPIPAVPDLPAVPAPEALSAAAVEALRSVPGGAPLVLAASAGGEPEGMSSPFLDSLRASWGPERAALADLFLFGAAVATDLLAATTLAALAALGFVDDLGGGRVASRFRVSPLLDRVVVADAALGHTDAILPPNATTLSLAAVVPALPPGRRAVDVGCGAGTIALVAGAGVATDRSPRAAALARLNAALNGVEVDARVGDLLDPVAGERFDLIVSQPPYLPHPPGVPATPYLHGGTTGDETARRLLASLRDHLTPTGVGVVRADRAEGTRPYAGIEVSWPGPGPADLAVAYAAVHVPVEGPDRDEVAAAYRAHLGRQRSTLVVVTPGGRTDVVEVDEAPPDWATLSRLAGL